MSASGKCIIITGPESVGKTTIARHVAGKFVGHYIPEFARDYVENLGHGYDYSDIEAIAKQQKDDFEKFRHASSGKLYVFDTLLIITKVWFKWHSGKYPLWIDELINETKDALYLLCEPDIEWVADRVRENGGDARKRLFNEYRSELGNFNLNYKIVKGAGEKRLACAEDFVSEYLEMKQ